MMRLPRALDNIDYANHVSPVGPAKNPQHAQASAGVSISRTFQQARERINALAKERAGKQQNLASAAAVVSKTGRKSYQTIHGENANLRRDNAWQRKELDGLKREARAVKLDYDALAEKYNETIKALHAAQWKLKEEQKKK
jgi:chromosome segregation ATPase